MMDRPLVFMAATVVRRDLVFVASQIVELNQREIDHTKVLMWNNGNWAHYMIDWPVTAIQHSHDGGLGIYSMGLYGRIHVAQGNQRRVEEIDDSAEGPSRRGVLRDFRLIDGLLYACGMQRQVYRRLAQDRWERIDQELVLPLGEKFVKSLDSIDGYNRSNLYAAGLDGEVWHRDRNHWMRVDVPTSISFEKVLCVNAETVYLAGQLGTIIEGWKDRWRIVDSGDLRDTIWDLAWFKGKVYACTSHSLFVIRHGKLDLVDLGLGERWSFGNLACNEDVLWSIGRSHLAYSEDGITWHDTTCTDGSY